MIRVSTKAMVMRTESRDKHILHWVEASYLNLFFLRCIYISHPYLDVFFSQIYNSLKEIFSFPVILELALKVRDKMKLTRLISQL